jgi:hypothetical protein
MFDRNPLLRTLRRFLIIVSVVLLPFYFVSLTENLQVPSAWHDIRTGDTHAAVRAGLRAGGMSDGQCEWIVVQRTVRCTLVGNHHAAGLLIGFDGDGREGRVTRVEIRQPVYTGPFHWHARLKRYF